MTAPFERRPKSPTSPKRNWKHGALVNTKNPGPNTSKVLALRLRRTGALVVQAYLVMTWLSEADRPTSAVGGVGNHNIRCFQQPYT